MTNILTKSNIQIYRTYILMIIIVFPLWSFANQYFVSPTDEYNDTYLLRLFFVSPGIIFYILSFKNNFFKKNIHIFFLVVCICMNLGHGYLAALSRFDYILVSGQILVMLLASVHLESIKHFLIFNILALLVVFIPSQGIPAVPISLYFLELLTVSLVTFVVLFQKLKLLKQLEESEKLLENERLNSFNSQKLASLAKMAGAIAHEINNPLTILSLYSKKMVKLAGNSPELIEINKDHQDTVLRISKIVSRLIAISRDGSKDSYSKISADVFVNDVIDIYLVKLKEEGIELNIKIEKNLDVYGRITELQQVLLGLVNNSYDSISKQENKEINIDLYKDNSFIVLKVKDNGAGIDLNTTHKIFDPFYTTKNTGDGVGLDLSISKRIIESHGGEIFVDPKSNSTLVIRIPIKE